MRAYLYITNPVSLASGDLGGLQISTEPPEEYLMLDTWPFAGTAEINLSIDNAEANQMAVDTVEAEKKAETANHQVKINRLDNILQSLKAIEHKS